MKEQLQNEITSTFKDLYESLAAFNESQINEIPFEGSWTAGQVGEHLTKALSGFGDLADGDTQESNRPFDQKIQELKDIFLDFSSKMKSPGFLEPTAKSHDKQALITTLCEKQKEFHETVEKHDLKKLSLESALPGTGNLTLYEWIRFALMHTQRHIHQLKKIYRHFDADANR